MTLYSSKLTPKGNHLSEAGGEATGPWKLAGALSNLFLQIGMICGSLLSCTTTRDWGLAKM